MTKHLRTFQLTEVVKKRLETLRFVLECARCGEPLRVGEIMVVRRGLGVHKLKRYHKHCWESMFL